jgi:hypothetical protein
MLFLAVTLGPLGWSTEDARSPNVRLTDADAISAGRARNQVICSTANSVNACQYRLRNGEAEPDFQSSERLSPPLWLSPWMRLGRISKRTSELAIASARNLVNGFCHELRNNADRPLQQPLDINRVLARVDVDVGCPLGRLVAGQHGERVQNCPPRHQGMRAALGLYTRSLGPVTRYLLHEQVATLLRLTQGDHDVNVRRPSRRTLSLVRPSAEARQNTEPFSHLNVMITPWLTPRC